MFFELVSKFDLPWTHSLVFSLNKAVLWAHHTFYLILMVVLRGQ